MFLWSIASVFTVVCCGDFLFWSYLFDVLCVSLAYMGVYFLKLGTWSVNVSSVHAIAKGLLSLIHGVAFIGWWPFHALCTFLAQSRLFYWRLFKKIIKKCLTWFRKFRDRSEKVSNCLCTTGRWKWWRVCWAALGCPKVFQYICSALARLTNGKQWEAWVILMWASRLL